MAIFLDGCTAKIAVDEDVVTALSCRPFNGGGEDIKVEIVSRAITKAVIEGEDARSAPTQGVHKAIRHIVEFSCRLPHAPKHLFGYAVLFGLAGKHKRGRCFRDSGTLCHLS